MKSVGTRFLLPFGLLCVLFSIFMLYRAYTVSRQHANELISQQAAMAMEFNLAIRDYAAKKIRPVMEGLVGKDEFIPETMSTSYISRNIFEEVRKKFPDYIIRFSSEHPRNPINQASPDELRMIESFRRNPQISQKTEEIRIDGKLYLAQFTPKWMTKDCMRCHGDPKDAPAALVKRYGATSSFHRTPGDVAGLDTVAIPAEKVHARLASEIRRRSLILVAGFVLLFGSVMVVFRFVVTRRLAVMANHFRAIANHPASQQMKAVEVGRYDEIGVLGAAFNKLVEQLRGAHASLELRVSQRTTELAKANSELRQEILDRKQVETALHRSEEEAKRLAQENAVIAKIGRIISSTPNIEEVYPLFSQKVEKLIPFDRIGINLIDLREGTHTIPYVAGPSVPGRQPGDMAPIAGTLLEKVVQSRKGIIIGMERAEEVAAEFPGLLPEFQEGFHSGLTVPLISGGEVIGGLALRSKGRGIYTDRDLRLAEGIGNQIAGAIANAQLYSEQKRVAEALRENEAIFSSFLEHSPVYVFFKDKDIRSLRLSKNFEQLLGIPIHQALGKTMDELFPSEFAKSMIADDLRILTEGKRVVVVEEFDGQIYETTKFPIFKDDKLFMLAGFTVDITEQKRAEEALRTSEEKFKAAFEGSHDAITITTEKGKVLDCNQRALGLFGLGGKDDFLDQRPADFSPPFQPDGRDSHKASREHISKVLNRGESMHFEWVHRRLNGETFPAEIILTSYPFKGETVLQATIRDITERKRAEEERQRLEERLSRAEKMEALGTLSGGVAHDLNNVLGVLVGYSELLLMKMEETHPLRNHVSYILQASQKAAAIIQDLLTMARRGVSISEVVNLNDVISSQLKTPEIEKLKSFHPAVTFKSKLEKELLNVRGSSVHLEKIVVNLLSNAAEAILDRGEVTLMTENRYLDKPVTGYDEIQEGDYVALRVSDNGKGISKEDLGKIFEPFYTKKVMGRSGTGLGLAVVWGTVKDHGGYIDVQSEEGRGSTFTVYFPVTREERVNDPKGVSTESYQGRGESILVVDDVKEQRDLATAMLNSLGYRVSAVSSGEEALTYLKTDKADLLVLDMIMDPGMDGLETYQRVLETNSKQKAIIVSGFSETNRVKKAQELGAGAYVRKPYIREKIGLAIRRELDK